MSKLNLIYVVFVLNSSSLIFLTSGSDFAGNVNYYKTPEGYLIENALQPSEQDVHLEDFFWTGSGDGMGYIKPISKPPVQNTIVRTATILATVYVDDNFASDFDPLCIIDCDKKPTGTEVNSFDNIPVSDRRYWLLTVIAGLFKESDFPILEDKLAKLYRVAFLRQQARHLGIANGNTTSTNISQFFNETLSRKKRQDDIKILVGPTDQAMNLSTIRTRNLVINRNVFENMNRHRRRLNRRNAKSPQSANVKIPIHSLHHSNTQKVSVMIHNLTALTAEDMANFDSNSLNEDAKNITNQTEILYSVFVGSKPILANIASQDIELVDQVEAEKILEKIIVLKAEPYLKEPQATPLIPSHMNGNFSGIESVIGHNLILFIVLCVMIILLVLLLVMLLVSKRHKKTLDKGLSTTEALVKTIDVIDHDIQTIRSGKNDVDKDAGIDNLAYEREKECTLPIGDRYQGKPPPVINFPLPPVSRPDQRPTSTSSSTSDSSVYYPKKNKMSIDEYLANKDRQGSPDQDVYTKAQKALKSNNKKRHRRLKGSRVGTIDVHSHPKNITCPNESFYDNNEPAYSSNISSQYHRNMVHQDKSFTVVESETTFKSQGHKYNEIESPQAINKELISNIQQNRPEKISFGDTGSIGSFLSMASVRSFPRCTMPESLAKVLEPVSVTHLDHSDAMDSDYRLMDSQKSIDLDDDEFFNNSIDERLSRTHSDGCDPGVINSGIWEIHRKKKGESPIRDPVILRNRFEGLLEGAMKLYGSNSYTNCHSVLNRPDEDDNSQVPGVIKQKEFRGKSAATIRLTSKTAGILSRSEISGNRPLTAGPGPSISAGFDARPSIKCGWQSGNGTPLIRPLSAGAYHKPDIPISSSTKTLLSSQSAISGNVSSSPIIDAIQNELQKLTKEEK